MDTMRTHSNGFNDKNDNMACGTWGMAGAYICYANDLFIVSRYSSAFFSFAMNVCSSAIWLFSSRTLIILRNVG